MFRFRSSTANDDENTSTSEIGILKTEAAWNVSKSLKTFLKRMIISLPIQSVTQTFGKQEVRAGKKDEQ
jgi:hypothetical protein